MKRYFQRLNNVLEYVESHILNDIDYTETAKIACCPVHQFGRIFSFTLEMTLAEYIRSRRLTLAAQELRESKAKIIDIALKYGYESHAAFSRAFKAHHGVPPEKAKKKNVPLNLFMPITFHALIGLDGDINYRFEEGEIKMAKLISAEFMGFGPYRVVGKEIRTKAMSQDISALWVSCFSDGTYETLLGLKEHIVPEKLGDEYVCCITEPDEYGGFSYLVGMIMKQGTPVPEGFDFRDISECTVVKTEIQGEEYDIYKSEFPLTKEAMRSRGYEPNYDNFFALEVYTDEKFGIPKNEGKKSLVLDYYIACKQK